ncbi:hypothetical protein ACIGEZ_09890 [Streptomyces sp. NPDC085481]|uniref:hypothetical protein n=1 Tax=Streptomyces sp. NPDC085481 TaxID=3365727 RepID=UPI0037D1B29D
MSTESQHSTSRITDALLPPDRPAAAQPLPAAQPMPAVETTTRLRPIREAAPARDPRPAPVRDARPAPARDAGPAPGREAAPARDPRPAPVRDPRPAPARDAGPAPGREAAPARDPRPARETRPAPARPGPALPAAAPLPPVASPRPSGVDRWAALPEETPAETTTRLRPVQDRNPARVLAVVGCGVLGLGLIGGALTGALLAGSGAGEPDEPPGYAEAGALWHDAPVDALFPRTLPGPSAGPGGATRTWTRIVVAPDAPCTAAALPKGLNAALHTVGCDRVLRATYTDATSSHVTTVALVFTQADPAAMRTLGSRGGEDLPPALSAPGTVAARFGDPQRASWWQHVLPDLPVVVTSVSGFADGRAIAEPEPAERAMTAKRTTAVAQAGLGHEAKGVGEAVERTLRGTLTATLEEDER